MQDNTCCFFGHRTITETEKLREDVTEAVERLIVEKQVDTFLFGSKSRFDGFCLEIVTALKQKYPHVKRVYVRAEFPIIGDNYLTYLLQSYDETEYPPTVLGAGRAAYVERNREMIDRSRYCLVYCDGQHIPTTRKSGTKIALDYAIKRGKEITIFPQA